MSDGRYDTEFPAMSAADELGKISRSVKKIYCLVEYDTYQFRETDGVNPGILRLSDLKQIATGKRFFNESVHGSAIVLKNDDQRIVVLTSAHVVNYPDTIYSFYLDHNGRKTNILESISIKRKQDNLIRNLPGEGALEIVAIDNELDVALLAGTFTGEIDGFPVLPYPPGKASDLEWGSFVYIFGYPAGHQMVTHGIVSNPVPTRNNEFIIDASFNTGISGGAVLAIRDGIPSFELVGIAKSVSAKYSNVLRPEKKLHIEKYNPNIPYRGELFVDMKKEINQGVTFTVSVDAILDFYLENRKSLAKKGYGLDAFFRRR